MDFIITAAELSEILRRDPTSIMLVDVREREEYAEAHIVGCRLIPLGELQSRALRELDPDADIVLYCAHGVRSVHAIMALSQLGFEKLRSLQGGLCAWQKEGHPAPSPKS
jgi:rhodanese-related sulfurtransferase